MNQSTNIKLMDTIKGIINEIKQEAVNTRKMLELVPKEHFDFKPHEKSMSLGRLATHIAELPSWIAFAVTTDQLDFSAGDYKPVHADNAAELVALHDECVNKAIAALERTNEQALMKEWTLRRGDYIILQMPKIAVIRSMALNHMIHHRGQLSVFLRLNNVPLPGIYGPTADDKLLAAVAQAI